MLQHLTSELGSVLAGSNIVLAETTFKSCVQSGSMAQSSVPKHSLPSDRAKVLVDCGVGINEPTNILSSGSKFSVHFGGIEGSLQ